MQILNQNSEDIDILHKTPITLKIRFCYGVPNVNFFSVFFTFFFFFVKVSGSGSTLIFFIKTKKNYKLEGGDANLQIIFLGLVLFTFMDVYFLDLKSETLIDKRQNNYGKEGTIVVPRAMLAPRPGSYSS